MTKTISYEEGGVAIGRGTRGGTFKELRAALQRYLKRRRVRQPDWRALRRKR